MYNEFIILDRQVLVSGTDYTLANNATASVITFLRRVWDSQTIVVYYEYTLAPISGYTNASLIYAKTGLSATEVNLSDSNILAVVQSDAESELEALTSRKFTDANSITEYIDGKDKDVIGNAQTAIQTNHFPIQSITEFLILDMDGNAMSTFGTLTAIQIAAGTVSTTDYWLGTQNDPLNDSVIPNGRIKLKTQTISKGTSNVKISYTYGYTTVPVPVRDLATCLAGVRMWIIFLGGQYNRLNSYSIPQQSVDKGDFYQRGKQSIDLLTDEANRLLDRIGRKPRTQFFATGIDR
jgi:hypothetical protein